MNRKKSAQTYSLMKWNKINSAFYLKINKHVYYFMGVCFFCSEPTVKELIYLRVIDFSSLQSQKAINSGGWQKTGLLAKWNFRTFSLNIVTVFLEYFSEFWSDFHKIYDSDVQHHAEDTYRFYMYLKSGAYNSPTNGF